MRLPFSDIPDLVLNYKRELQKEHPGRVNDLDFDVLLPDGRGKKPEYHFYAFRNLIRSTENNPALLLTAVAGHLKLMNRYKTSCATRLHHLDIACSASYKAIHEIYRVLTSKEEFPETQKRRDTVIPAIESVRNLIAGYKIVFKQYLSLPDKLFYPLKQRVRFLGFRIMELVYLEQHLGVLRYQKLPEYAWRDCNQLYFFLRSISFDEEEFSFQGNLHDQFPGSSGKGQATLSSAKHLYVLIQMMGLMDVISWPREHLKKMEAYVFASVHSVKIHNDHGRELAQSNLVVYQQQICPPFFNRLNTGTTDALILDVSGFENKLRERYGAVVSEKAANTEGAVINLSLDDFDEQGLLDKMLNKLYFFRRSEPRKYVNQFSDLELFFGFKNCFQFVRDLATPDYDLLSSGFSLRKTLAGQTSAILSESGEKNENRWFVINESQGGIHLRMQETRYSPNMFIGQMVVVNVHEVSSSDFNIGYVSRIHRGRSNDIEITIIKLGNEAQVVGVQDESLKSKGDLVPSILITSYSGKKLLLMYSKQQIILGSDLSIIWKNDAQLLELGQKYIKMPEFAGFEINYHPEKTG